MNIDDRKGRFIFSILIRTRDSPFFIRYQRRISSALRPSPLFVPLHPVLLLHLPSSGGKGSVKDYLFKVSLPNDLTHHRICCQ